MKPLNAPQGLHVRVAQLLCILAALLPGCSTQPSRRITLPQIMQALNTKPSSETGSLALIRSECRRINVPGGDYTLKEPLVFDGLEDVLIIFARNGSVVCSNPEGPAILVKDCSNIDIRGGSFAFAPAKRVGSAGAVFDISQSRGVRIADVEVFGGGNAIRVSNVDGITIDNCHIHDNSDTAIVFRYVKNIHLRWCVIERNWRGMAMYEGTGSSLDENGIYSNNGAGYFHSGYYEERNAPPKK